MMFYIENFDTKILKKDVFKLILENDNVEKKDFLKLFSAQHVDIVFCFAKFSARNIELMDRLEFNLISTRVTYKLLNTDKCKEKRNNMQKGYSLIQNSKRNFDLRTEDIEKITRVLVSTSRYFKDRLIKEEESLEIYNRWIENSLYDHYADESFLVIVNGNELAGLITLKIKDGSGFIDLMGVRDEFQRLGLGNLLLCGGVKYFIKKGIKNIFVITEGENLASNAFYQKNGFAMCDFELVYHKHYNY